MRNYLLFHSPSSLIFVLLISGWIQWLMGYPKELLNRHISLGVWIQYLFHLIIAQYSHEFNNCLGVWLFDVKEHMFYNILMAWEGGCDFAVINLH